ncbi:14930_t:CDS:2 [Entrophospora sp. SA101]|nr:14930_t:CDS:2 [Entrophospora sp. SA101]
MSCMYTYCNNNNNIVIGSSSNYSTIITPSSSCSHSPLKLDPNALSLATKIDFDTQYRNLLTNIPGAARRNSTTPAAISTVPETTQAAIPTQQLQESKKLQQQRFQVLQPPQQQFQQQQTGIPLLQQTNTYPTNSSSRHNCVKNIIESGNEDLQVNPQDNVDLVNGRVMREGGFISLSSGIEDLQVYPRQSQGGNHRSTEGCVLPTSTYNHQTNDQQQSSHDDYYDTYLYTYEQLMQSSGVVIDPAVQTPP